MTNYQHYEKSIISILKSGSAIAVRNGKLACCDSIKCYECDCNPDCNNKLGAWLEKEHIEMDSYEAEIRSDAIAKFTYWCTLHGYKLYDWKMLIRQYEEEAPYYE